MNGIWKGISGAATALLLAAVFTVSGGSTPATASLQDYDALDIIECDLDGCERTGVRCAPTCYTGFCCHLPDPN